MTFPSMPGWDGIHPAMVQFAIVLLCTAPVFLLVSLFARRTWLPWAGAALLAMGLGSIAAWLATASGHAAGQLVDKTPLLEHAIARHEALGLQTRNLFTALTAGFALTLLMPAVIRKGWPPAARIGLHAVFLLVYLGLTVVIANTASQGGRLVHDLGVRAVVGPTTARDSLVAEAQEARPVPPTASGAPTPRPAPAAP